MLVRVFHLIVTRTGTGDGCLFLLEPRAVDSKALKRVKPTQPRSGVSPLRLNWAARASLSDLVKVSKQLISLVQIKQRNFLFTLLNFVVLEGGREEEVGGLGFWAPQWNLYSSHKSRCVPKEPLPRGGGGGGGGGGTNN